MKSAEEKWIERERHDSAKERALAQLGRELVARGWERGKISDLVGDLLDEKRRRDHAKVELDNGTLVDWEAAMCWNDQQNRHRLNGRAPKHLYDSRLEPSEDEPIKRIADVIDDIDTEAVAA